MLDAEVKIGELMRDVPKANGGQPYHEKSTRPTSGSSRKSKRKAIEDAGFTKTQAQRFETLAANPEIVEQAKAEARMTKYTARVKKCEK